MASETFATYITKTRRYVQEETASTSFWTDDFLKQVFNESYKRRSMQLIMAFEGYFTMVSETNLVVDQARYTWPGGFLRLQKMEMKRSVDGRLIPLRRFERHEEVNQPSVDGGDTYFPQYRLLEEGFVLEPTPTGASTTSTQLRIEYTGIPPQLVNGTSVLHPDFPEGFDDILVLDTALSAMDSESNVENGVVRSILRRRNELELDWERFIDSRVIATQRIRPFVGPYEDA